MLHGVEGGRPADFWDRGTLWHWDPDGPAVDHAWVYYTDGSSEVVNERARDRRRRAATGVEQLLAVARVHHVDAPGLHVQGRGQLLGVAVVQHHEALVARAARADLVGQVGGRAPAGADRWRDTAPPRAPRAPRP